ncbi:MAG: preprotein translocase subunit SecG [Alistipes sp.]
MYITCIVLIAIASLLVIFAVLVQSPKSGMAANFGAGNQVMGVRESSNFLERFTWTMAVAIVVLSLVATLAMDSALVDKSNKEVSKDANALIDKSMEQTVPVPQATIPAETTTTEAPATGAATTEAPAQTPEKTK